MGEIALALPRGRLLMTLSSPRAALFFTFHVIRMQPKIREPVVHEGAIIRDCSCITALKSHRQLWGYVVEYV